MKNFTLRHTPVMRDCSPPLNASSSQLCHCLEITFICSWVHRKPFDWQNCTISSPSNTCSHTVYARWCNHPQIISYTFWTQIQESFGNWRVRQTFSPVGVNVFIRHLPSLLAFIRKPVLFTKAKFKCQMTKFRLHLHSWAVHSNLLVW